MQSRRNNRWMIIGLGLGAIPGCFLFQCMIAIDATASLHYNLYQ
jgi:hypothetical protein